MDEGAKRHAAEAFLYSPVYRGIRATEGIAEHHPLRSGGFGDGNPGREPSVALRVSPTGFQHPAPSQLLPHRNGPAVHHHWDELGARPGQTRQRRVSQAVVAAALRERERSCCAVLGDRKARRRDILVSGAARRDNW